jgi:hypothetical protein
VEIAQNQAQKAKSATEAALLDSVVLGIELLVRKPPNGYQGTIFLMPFFFLLLDSLPLLLVVVES